MESENAGALWGGAAKASVCVFFRYLESLLCPDRLMGRKVTQLITFTLNTLSPSPLFLSLLPLLLHDFHFFYIPVAAPGLAGNASAPANGDRAAWWAW